MYNLVFIRNKSYLVGISETTREITLSEQKSSLKSTLCSDICPLISEDLNKEDNVNNAVYIAEDSYITTKSTFKYNSNKRCDNSVRINNENFNDRPTPTDGNLSSLSMPFNQ